MNKQVNRLAKYNYIHTFLMTGWRAEPQALPHAARPPICMCICIYIICVTCVYVVSGLMYNTNKQVHIYICMYVYIYTYIHTYMHICILIHTCTYTHARRYIQSYIHSCLRTFVCTYMHAYIYSFRTYMYIMHKSRSDKNIMQVNIVEHLAFAVSFTPP